MITNPLPFLGRPQTFKGEGGETMTFGTFEPDPLCVLFSLQGADGRQFACLLGDEVEAALLALLRDRERARHDVSISSNGGPGGGTS
ncbi:MAG: hypothetical protein K2X46_06560 [Roseomonas sp.]|nr:hypothetical protein [Roseomonas sp.]